MSSMRSGWGWMVEIEVVGRVVMLALVTGSTLAILTGKPMNRFLGPISKNYTCLIYTVLSHTTTGVL